MKGIIRAADLFAGAGGASNGLARACERVGRRLDLVAVNHWPIAVETHAANHPRARHLCEDIESVNPRKAVPGGRLDLLLAGPSCVHHSTARGGKPINDQQRASAWCILRWATDLTIDSILIENVPEFRSWGPIGSNGRPLKSRKGETFQAFISALQSLGYRVDWRVLNAADYGDPTTRARLFIQCRRGRRPIVWPEPTHAPGGDKDLFGERKPWRAARDIIDWSIPGQSIFARKRPLSPNTIARIAAGLRKFGGAAAEPFLVLLNGGGRQGAGGVQGLGKPLPVVTAGGNHFGLCEPFLIQAGGPTGKARQPRSVDDPLATVMTENHTGVVQPFIVPTNYGERPGQSPRCHSVDDPLPTVVGTVAHGVVEPFILPPEGVHRGNAPRSVYAPLQTVLASRGAGHLVEPFIVNAANQGGDRCYPIDGPLPTVTTIKRHAIVEPFICSAGGPKVDARPVSQPLNTVLTRDHMALVEPFLTRYNNNRAEVCARDINDPIPALDCNDRYGLVTTDGLRLDIRFRMLQPHELAAAMSFPAGYEFRGNREQKVKQIGNAWAGELAAALCEAMIAG